MSVPTFYRINLESLTPNLYNAYLAGDYVCEYFDNVFGSILNNNESYLLSARQRNDKRLLRTSAYLATLKKMQVQ